MGIGKGNAFVVVEKEESVQRDKQNYDRLRATDGDNDLDSSSPNRYDESMVAVVRNKSRGYCSEIRSCNTKTGLDMSFSYMDEKKRPVPVAQYKNKNWQDINIFWK